MQVTPAQIEAIRTWAARSAEIGAVYLFGSRIKGTARPDSDLDVAITLTMDDASAEMVWFDNGWLWRDALKAATGFQVDLQPIRADGPNLRAYVQDQGILIYRSIED